MKSSTVKNRPRPILLSTVVAGAFMLGASGCTITPKPLDTDELNKAYNVTLPTLFDGQAPLTGPIDLYEAIARAIKYNLDYKVEATERRLAIEQLDLSKYDMWPELIGDIGYKGRNNFDGSNSRSLLTGQQSLEYSTSTDRDLQYADLTLTWNILDFGLAYYRTKQKADEIQVAAQSERRVLSRLVQDVRNAYWRAVGAEQLLPKLKKMLVEVSAAIDDSRKIAAEGKQAPIQPKTYQRELFASKRELLNLIEDLSLARTQLAALINLPPGTQYEIAVPKTLDMSLTKSNFDLDQLDELALAYRPELQTITLRERINAQEMRARLYELLPGIELFAGAHITSNSYAWEENWLDWGGTVTWNLLNVFRYPQTKKTVAAQDEVLDSSRRALVMAIMTQTRVALARFNSALERLENENDYVKVQHDIAEITRKSARNGRGSRQAEIREDMSSLIAETQEYVAYAAAQNARAGIFASVGVEPIPVAFNDMSVSDLAGSLREYWGERGHENLADYKKLLDEAPAATPAPPAPPTPEQTADQFKAVLDKSGHGGNWLFQSELEAAKAR